MASPADRRYLDSHEWHKPAADGTVTIGISQFAVDELTDITYVDVKKKTGAIKAGESFGEIESVKAVSDLVSPVDGEVVEVNSELVDALDRVANDPYGAGWMIKVAPASDGDRAALLDAATYRAQVESEQG